MPDRAFRRLGSVAMGTVDGSSFDHRPMGPDRRSVPVGPDRPVAPDRRSVLVVPHTHWDREWYRTFQQFRLQLVDLIDGLIDQLTADDHQPPFLLDGQVAAVDDYLELRPERAAALCALAADGRLAVGPWYVLPDELLVSGECTVRNLEAGQARAAELGAVLPVGYLPDMFGHAAQMPQVLAQFGLAHAVVWRGVPAAMRRHRAFRWEAPDGSSVRAEVLPDGYDNGADLRHGPHGMVAEVDEFVARHGPLLGDAGPVLWLVGTDHQRPEPRLARWVVEADGLQDRYRFEVVPLDVALARSAAADPPGGLPRWRGELRSAAGANLLAGVASNRLDVRQAVARAQHALERWAEPVAALFDSPSRWPAAALGLAWRQVVRNAAHDSVGACSHDDVVADVLGRYRAAIDIATVAGHEALARFGGAADGDRLVVVNPSPRPRTGVVTVTVAGTEAPPGTQQVAAHPARRLVGVVPASAVATTVVRELRFDEAVEAIEVVDPATGAVVWSATRAELAWGTPAGRASAPASTEQAPAQQSPAEQGPAAPRHALHGTIERVVAAAGLPEAAVVVTVEPRQDLLVPVATVPGFGWRDWDPAGVDAPGAPGAAPVLVAEVEAPHGDPHELAVGVDDDRATPVPPRASGPGGEALLVTNGLVTVVVDGDTGRWSLGGTAGFGELVDGGDVGDTYTFCPPHEDQQVTAPVPGTVTVAVVRGGPVQALVRVTATYRWPRCAVETHHRVPAVGATEGPAHLEGRGTTPDRATSQDRSEDGGLAVTGHRPSAATVEDAAFESAATAAPADRPRGDLPPIARSRRSGETVDVAVTTDLTITVGSPAVVVEHRFDNRAQDHRLRAILPLPQPATGSEADGMFGPVRRGLHGEGGPSEQAVATFPSARWVRAGGLAIAHEGLNEYELVDLDAQGRAQALALTVVRCTGALSRGPMPTRALPAGPAVATPAAQLPGPVAVRYAVALDPAGAADPAPRTMGAVGVVDVDVVDGIDGVSPAEALADELLQPLVTVRAATAEAGGPDSEGSRLPLDLGGAVVSAVRRVPATFGSGAPGARLPDGSWPVELRLHNPTAQPVTVALPGQAGHVVSLSGQDQGPFADQVTIAPHRICTLRFPLCLGGAPLR